MCCIPAARNANSAGNADVLWAVANPLCHSNRADLSFGPPGFLHPTEGLGLSEVSGRNACHRASWDGDSREDGEGGLQKKGYFPPGAWSLAAPQPPPLGSSLKTDRI